MLENVSREIKLYMKSSKGIPVFFRSKLQKIGSQKDLLDYFSSDAKETIQDKISEAKTLI